MKDRKRSKSGIAYVTLRLTDYCKRVIGACTLLDKVLSGMVAKPRSQVSLREWGNECLTLAW
jgi:hypothetical protein